MAISKHLLFSVFFLVLAFLLASSEPADNRRPPSPRPPPPRRPPSPPPPRPQSPPPPRPSPPPRPQSPPPPRPSPPPRPQSPPPPRPSPPPPSSPPKPPGFDYFMLALQWPNSVCFASYTCNPTVPKQQRFTIHGLWPRKNYGAQPRDCDTDQKMTDDILNKEEFKNDLLDYWPHLLNSDSLYKSKMFVKKQWNKHGSCSANKFSPEAYLKITIALGKKYGPLILTKMEGAGIKPDGSTLHTARKTLDAIKAATNAAAKITCSTVLDRFQLDEIRLCVKADGETLQDCKTEGSCNKEFIFPSPYTKTHSRFPSFLSSMLDVEEAVGI